MSFICDGCGNPAPNGTKQNKRVIKTRHKVYTRTVETKHGPKEVPVGQGNETVKEANFCEKCVEAVDNLE